MTAASLPASIREVASPLTEAMLAPLDARCRTVQFKSLLIDRDFERLADLLRESPLVTLRAYGSYDGTITDLEFLRFFPFLRRFAADALFNSLGNLDGLRHLPDDLESLTLGRTKRKLPLNGLAKFERLRSLYLEGQTKGIEVLRRLPSLVDLTLRSITLPDLSLLTSLVELRALDIKLGGTKDLHLLPEVGKVEYLELWMVRALSDVSVVGRLAQLKYLFLQALKNVRNLPLLDGCERLLGVHLETMKGLTDLTPLASAPALEQLFLIDMGHLAVDDLRCLVGHPTLRQARIGLGSKRKNQAAAALLALPDAQRIRPWSEVL